MLNTTVCEGRFPTRGHGGLRAHLCACTSAASDSLNGDFPLATGLDVTTPGSLRRKPVDVPYAHVVARLMNITACTYPIGSIRVSLSPERSAASSHLNIRKKRYGCETNRRFLRCKALGRYLCTCAYKVAFLSTCCPATRPFWGVPDIPARPRPGRFSTLKIDQARLRA